MTVTFADLVRALWARKFLLIGLGLAGFIAGILLSLTVKPMWRGEALLAEARGMDLQPGLTGGGLLGSLGRLAALPGGDGRLDEYAAVMTSPAFLQKLLIEDRLIETLYPELWDPISKTWRPDPNPGLADRLGNLRSGLSDWLNGLGSAPALPAGAPGGKLAELGRPSLEEATLRLQQLMQVRIDRKTSLMSVAIDAPSPTQARDLVLLAIQRLNEHEAQIAAAESARRTVYLREQLMGVNENAVVEALSRSLEVELTRGMLAQTSPQFAVRYVSPPVEPETRVRPARLQMGLFFGIMAGLAGVVWIAWSLLRQARSVPPDEPLETAPQVPEPLA